VDRRERRQAARFLEAEWGIDNFERKMKAHLAAQALGVEVDDDDV
jgi:sulfite reductase beta subunit-like hemoprotein